MNTSSLSIACIRSLVIDQINKSKSGHPGMAIGSAPILYTLFTRHLKADPTHPKWMNRDRFILSAGHASALLYATLHVAGYDLSIDDLKQFRQLDSRTPGHPEIDVTPGVDCSAGPLGQGIAQAVGFALAEQSLKNLYPNGKNIFDENSPLQFVYVPGRYKNPTFCNMPIKKLDVVEHTQNIPNHKHRIIRCFFQV